MWPLDWHLMRGLVAAVLLLILVVVLALVVAALCPRPTVEGGEESPGNHEITRAHALHVLGQVSAAAKTGQHPAGLVKAPAGAPVAPAPVEIEKIGGAARPDSWMKFKSWKALAANPPAHKEYWRDRHATLSDLGLDWSGVRQSLARELRDNREWAGLINIVNGAPRVVRKIPSPFRVNEETTGQVAAIVPADIVEELAATPAMFLFHTHPRGTHPLISPHDAVLALLHTYLGHHAAHVVVSPDAITMYGCRADLYQEIWKSPEPHLTALVRAFDMFTAMTGLRSWPPGHTVRDVRALMDRHWFLHVLYPTDSFARLEHNRRIKPWSDTDFDMLASLEVDLKEAERAAEARRRRAKKSA